MAAALMSGAEVANGGSGDPDGLGVNEPRIRETKAPISSVIRLIRSRIVLKKAVPGIGAGAAGGAFWFCPTDATAWTDCNRFWSRSKLTRTRRT